MAESVFHVDGSTSTLLGILNQFHGASDLNYKTLLATTINSKRNVLSDIPPPSLPVLRYFGIGLNGFYNIDDGNGRAPHQPLPTNMDLYEPIPFRCVPVEEDLSAEERSKYRMRERVFKDGNYYYCYWLKLIEYYPREVTIIQRTPSGAEDTFNIVDPSTIAGKLMPVPPTLSTGGLTPLSQNRLLVRATGTCPVTGAEVAEAINVLYDGNLNKALISELGFYTGCDIYTVTTETGDQPLRMGNNLVPVVIGTEAPSEATSAEAVYVQLSKHRCFIGTELQNSGDTFTPTIAFEAGGVIDI